MIIAESFEVNDKVILKQLKGRAVSQWKMKLKKTHHEPEKAIFP